MLVITLLLSQASEGTKVAWKMDQTPGCSRVLLLSQEGFNFQVTLKEFSFWGISLELSVHVFTKK